VALRSVGFSGASAESKEARREQEVLTLQGDMIARAVDRWIESNVAAPSWIIDRHHA
jgi:hypothetical protein